MTAIGNAGSGPAIRATSDGAPNRRTARGHCICTALLGVSTSAGHVSLHVEYTNAKTTVCPRSDAAVTVFPSWSLSVKSGIRAPGGRSAPCQPEGTDSPPACASHTPKTPAAAQTTSVVSASATREGTYESLGYRQAAPDRV